MFNPKNLTDQFEDMMSGMMKDGPLTSQINQLLFPEVDTEAMLAAQQKDVDALIEANRIMTEGSHEIFKQRMAMMQAASREAVDGAKALKEKKLSPEEFEDARVKIAQAAFDKAVSAAEELAATAQKVSEDAMKVITARTRESIAE